MTESMSFMPSLTITQPQALKTALMCLLLFHEAEKQDAVAARTFTFLTALVLNSASTYWTSFSGLLHRQQVP